LGDRGEARARARAKGLKPPTSEMTTTLRTKKRLRVDLTKGRQACNKGEGLRRAAHREKTPPAHSVRHRRSGADESFASWDFWINGGKSITKMVSRPRCILAPRVPVRTKIQTKQIPTVSPDNTAIPSQEGLHHLLGIIESKQFRTLEKKGTKHRSTPP